jgi:hypothetical protein
MTLELARRVRSFALRAAESVMKRNPVTVLAVAFAHFFAFFAPAEARPRSREPLHKRTVNGHPIICGTYIAVKPYAADRFFPRPSICGGGIVNNN